jgi:tRNA uridine 5-carbamoylmethylation protein Kti12
MASASLFVIVSGMPAAGKTTLAQQIAREPTSGRQPIAMNHGCSDASRIACCS